MKTMLAALVLVSAAGCACPPVATPTSSGDGPSTPGAGETPAADHHGDHGKPAGHHGKHGEPAGPHGKHGEHAGHHGKHGEHAGHHGKGHGPLVHRFTEDPEVWRKRFEEPGRDASQKPADVVKAMGLAPGMTVADIGAGTGYFMEHLASAVGANGRVLAIDIEPTMARYLKARAEKQGHTNVSARLALTDDPLLEADSVDRALIVNTWHHIPKRETYAKRLFTATAPGGEVWIIDFTMETTRGPSKAHRLAPKVVLQELESAGFNTRLDDKLLPDQYIVIGKRPKS